MKSNLNRTRTIKYLLKKWKKLQDFIFVLFALTVTLLIRTIITILFLIKMKKVQPHFEKSIIFSFSAILNYVIIWALTLFILNHGYSYLKLGGFVLYKMVFPQAIFATSVSDYKKIKTCYYTDKNGDLQGFYSRWNKDGSRESEKEAIMITNSMEKLLSGMIME